MGFAQEWLSTLNSSLEKEECYQEIFEKITKESSFSDKKWRKLLTSPFIELSLAVRSSGFQDEVAVRQLHQIRYMVKFLFPSSSNGKVSKQRLIDLIEIIEKTTFFFGPGYEKDHPWRQQILIKLKKLEEDKNLLIKLERFQSPSFAQAQTFVSQTLLLPTTKIPSAVETRRAVLSAWLTCLRQNVGSCFATAPAILIQNEQPYQFFEDLEQLFNKGELKRTFDGHEYKAPLSPTWGAGDLRRPVQFSPETFNVWKSPGILSACIKVKIVDKKQSLVEQQAIVKTLVQKTYLNFFSNKNNKQLVSAECVIQSILFEFHQVDREKVEKFLLSQKSSQDFLDNFSSNPLIEKCLDEIEKAKDSFNALENNALLKAWEYTLASFSEAKAGFTTFNLYKSLGMDSADLNGVGGVLYEILQESLQEENAKLEYWQEQHEQVYAELKTSESRLGHARDQQEQRYLKAEYYRRVADFKHTEDNFKQAQAQAQQIADLYPFLIRWYEARFIEYFQEVYDANLHEIAPDIFDDSPAGFRLYFKFGLQVVSQWKAVGNIEEYSQSLKDFFVTTESSLLLDCPNEFLKNKAIICTTKLVQLVQSEEFLKAAVTRMAVQHGEDVGGDLSHIKTKPWVYPSGGTMETLVNLYYSHQLTLDKKSTWVESETELLAFFIDTLKNLSPKSQGLVDKIPFKNLLAFSPTHAFNILPHQEVFSQGWQDPQYTYTWIKNYIIEPQISFWHKQRLSKEESQFLIDAFIKKLPLKLVKEIKTDLSALDNVTALELKKSIIFQTKHIRGLRRYLEEIDVLFLEHIPFTARNELRDIIELFAEKFSWNNHNQIFQIFLDKRYSSPYYSQKELINILSVFFLLEIGEVATSFSWKKALVEQLKAIGKMLPCVCITADTNWMHEYFAFLVSPGTEELEFWRVNSFGNLGRPINSWKQYFNGSLKNERWGVLVDPFQYLLQ
jgi:hypothetical protein